MRIAWQAPERFYTLNKHHTVLKHVCSVCEIGEKEGSPVVSLLIKYISRQSL